MFSILRFQTNLLNPISDHHGQEQTSVFWPDGRSHSSSRPTLAWVWHSSAPACFGLSYGAVSALTQSLNIMISLVCYQWFRWYDKADLSWYEIWLSLAIQKLLIMGFAIMQIKIFHSLNPLGTCGSSLSTFLRIQILYSFLQHFMCFLLDA